MTILHEQTSEKSVARLQKLQATVSKVMRRSNAHSLAPDGTVIPSSETVPGDIVKLTAGDKVPADCRIIATSRITVDQASLTGESEVVEKMETTVASNTALVGQVSMVYAGTTVVSGGATAVVVHTGMNTEFGKIQSSLDAAAPQKTPLAM